MDRELSKVKTMEEELETEKLLFEEPELEFIKFSGSDIVTASGEMDLPIIDDDDPDIDFPIIDDEGGTEGGGGDEPGGGGEDEPGGGGDSGETETPEY